MRRPRPFLVVAAIACVVAAGLHYRFHYAARERPARPGPEAVALLADGSWSAVVWIPFPHQNLALLEQRVGDLRRHAAALAAADDPDAAWRIPGFGPFPTPPARELVIGFGDGGATRARVRVYPIIAALARAAGTVAGNPWLAGGELRDADGNPNGEVKWDGTLWSYERKGSAPALGSAPGVAHGAEMRSTSERLPVKGRGVRRSRRSRGDSGDSIAERNEGLVAERGPADSDESAAPSPSLEASSLGLLALARGWDPLPPGVYRISRSAESGRLELTSGAVPGGSLLPAALVGGAAAPDGWYLERDEAAAGALRAFAVWSDPGAVAGLPEIATLDRGGIKRFSLPGEALLKLVGDRALERSAGGFRIRALDAGAAGRGEGFAGALDREGVVAERRAAVLAVARPDPLEPVVRGIADKLGMLPGLAEPERRAFARAAAVLRLLRGCSAATLEVGSGGSFARLIPCAGSVLDRGQSR